MNCLKRGIEKLPERWEAVMNNREYTIYCLFDYLCKNKLFGNAKNPHELMHQLNISDRIIVHVLIYLPVFAPVHVRLVQVSEQCEFVFPFADSLERAAPLPHSRLLLVLIVQTQTLFHLHSELQWNSGMHYTSVVVDTIIILYIYFGSFFYYRLQVIGGCYCFDRYF
jgi:hypothetical protein